MFKKKKKLKLRLLTSVIHQYGIQILKTNKQTMHNSDMPSFQEDALFVLLVLW